MARLPRHAKRCDLFDRLHGAAKGMCDTGPIKDGAGGALNLPHYERKPVVRELAGCGSVTVATIHAALKKDPGAREAIARVKASATQRRQTGPGMTGR